MQTSTTRPELLDLAVCPSEHTAADPRFELVANERYVLLLGPSPEFTNVQRPRLDDANLEPTLAEIRAIVAQHGHRNTEWWVPPFATPPDLVTRLLGLGFEPHADDPELVGMVLERAPEPGPPGIETCVVTTEDELLQAAEIEWEAFGTTASDREAQRRGLPERLRTERELGTARTFLAIVDGSPAAAAVAVFAPAGVLLVGGSTLPWARGRGAYRALVRARWEAAAERGTPALVVQAGKMSGPILRRLGFTEVVRLAQLVDVVGST